MLWYFGEAIIKARKLLVWCPRTIGEKRKPFLFYAVADAVLPKSFFWDVGEKRESGKGAVIWHSNEFS